PPARLYSLSLHDALPIYIRAVVRATKLPILLYNNPLAYKTDFTPEQIAELAAEFPQIEAVKESSCDIRRFAAIRALIGDRLDLIDRKSTRLNSSHVKISY